MVELKKKLFAISFFAFFATIEFSIYTEHHRRLLNICMRKICKTKKKYVESIWTATTQYFIALMKGFWCISETLFHSFEPFYISWNAPFSVFKVVLLHFFFKVHMICTNKHLHLQFLFYQFEKGIDMNFHYRNINTRDVVVDVLK